MDKYLYNKLRRLHRPGRGKQMKAEILQEFLVKADRAPNLGLVERFNFGLLPRFNLSLVARFNFGLPT